MSVLKSFVLCVFLVVVSVSHECSARSRGFAYRPDFGGADGNAGVDYNTLSNDGSDKIDVGRLMRERDAADRFETVPVTSSTIHGTRVAETPSVTLLDRLKDTPNENILRQAARLARMDAFLDDPSRELTLFAPTDRAFEFLPEGALEFIEAKPRELKYVIQSHVAQTAVDLSEFRDGMTLSGIDGTAHDIRRVQADGKGGGGYWTIDGIRIIEGDVFAENGVMHKIDGILGSNKVALPPSEDMKAALAICRETKGLRGFQLATCVRLVAQGLDSDDIPVRPDVADLP